MGVFSCSVSATTAIYALSLHDALPILLGTACGRKAMKSKIERPRIKERSTIHEKQRLTTIVTVRSEEHTSELQSPCNLVCRLLLEKKKVTTLDGLRGCARQPQQIPREH